MFTRFQSFLAVVAFFSITFFTFSCTKPTVDGTTTGPSTAAPQLIAYFDALEHVLYYLETHKERVIAGSAVMDWTDEFVLCRGYTILGEPTEFGAYPVAVGADELNEIATHMTDLFLTQVSSSSGGQVVPFREHSGMTCGTVVNKNDTCQNNTGMNTPNDPTDDTSTKKDYQRITQCKVTNDERDECTEYELVWYLETKHDALDCGGNIVGNPIQHSTWQCLP